MAAIPAATVVKSVQVCVDKPPLLPFELLPELALEFPVEFPPLEPPLLLPVLLLAPVLFPEMELDFVGDGAL